MELLIAGKVLGSHNLKGEVKVLSNIENIELLNGENSFRVKKNSQKNY